MPGGNVALLNGGAPPAPINPLMTRDFWATVNPSTFQQRRGRGIDFDDIMVQDMMSKARDPSIDRREWGDLYSHWTQVSNRPSLADRFMLPLIFGGLTAGIGAATGASEGLASMAFNPGEAEPVTASFGGTPPFFPGGGGSEGNFEGGFGGFENPQFFSDFTPPFSDTSIDFNTGLPSWATLPYLTQPAGGPGPNNLPEELWRRILKQQRPRGLMDMAMGVYGLTRARSARQDAREAAAMQQDPFEPQRAQAAAKLSALMRNPSSITSTPGYDAGLEAVNRGLAATGYIGSGNQITALQKYGGDFYDREMARLSTLSRPSFAPSAGNTRLMGDRMADEIRRRSLENIAFGAAGYMSS